MTIICHSNFFAHRMLTDEGACVHEHQSDSFEDVGDAESGPCLSGGPAFDKYAGDSHDFIIDHTGLIVYDQCIDWDLHRFCEQMIAESPGEEWPEDHYKRPRRTGEDWQVTYTDEDGPWWACHGSGWSDDAREAGFFAKTQAEQIALRFNNNKPDFSSFARLVSRIAEPPIFQPATSFKIDLHETQRLHIIHALRFMRERDPNYPALKNEPGKYFDTAQRDFDILLEMLEELPQTEAECPGALHGFAA